MSGDLIFFRDPSGYGHHNGIYGGDDRLLHPPHTGDVIKYSSLSQPYCRNQYAGARRVSG